MFGGSLLSGPGRKPFNFEKKKWPRGKGVWVGVGGWCGVGESKFGPNDKT